MAKLFVNRSIEINAAPSKVWQVLTDPSLTAGWVPEFGIKGSLHSDWTMGSKVSWKDLDGRTFVEGTVTGLQPYKFLRYTVFDMGSKERPPVAEEDGITFRLSEEKGNTKLDLTQGDFSVMTEGQKYHQMSSEVWDRVLPKIKELSEK
jgi:uncharacterized protein YndB with AHSA1/START domain